MAYLKHNDKVYQVTVKPSGHIVTMEFLSGQPAVITTGFKLYLDPECKMLIGRYPDYKTVYRNDEETAKYNGYQLSDDGSVYVEPVLPVPELTFVAGTGGTLEGKTKQEADSWDTVVIPTPVPKEGYVFVEWYPEIPDTGKVENSATYTAIFKDCHVYFAFDGGGYLEGEVCQLVDDYSELVIPVPVSYEDYKFTGWSPEIPTDGEIDMDKLHFTAVFVSNIPDRVASLEGDMIAWNKALGGE